MKKTTAFSLLLNIILSAFLWFLIDVFGGWKYVKYRVQTRQSGGSYENRKDLFNRLSAKKSPESIVFLGDSQVEQGEWRELFGDSLDIKNRGIVGDGATGILSRTDTILAAEPREIWLWFGVNDLIFGNSIEQTAGGYENVVQKIFSKKNPPRVRILEIIPTNSTVKKVPVSNENIRILNEKLREISKKYGADFATVASSVTDENGALRADLTSDGLHLNGKGYDEIARFLSK